LNRPNTRIVPNGDHGLLDQLFLFSIINIHNITSFWRKVCFIPARSLYALGRALLLSHLLNLCSRTGYYEVHFHTNRYLRFGDILEKLRTFAARTSPKVPQCPFSIKPRARGGASYNTQRLVL
jgi:hypothetical protein